MKRLVKAPGLAMPSAPRVPDQLPVLTRGWHRGPTDGACVMEYVSVLAGGRFTDHPRCTPPALAALARLVNDRIVDDNVRSRLALLAPDLIEVRAGPATTHCVVAWCLVTAASLQPAPPRAAKRRLVRTRARLRRLERGDRWVRVWMRCWEVLNPPNVMVNTAFQLVVERMRDLPQPERDARLSELLHIAVAECRMLADQATPDRPGSRSGSIAAGRGRRHAAGYRRRQASRGGNRE
jgi:hypothetical protein